MAIYSHLNLDYLVSLSLVVAWRSAWWLDKFLYVSCLVQDMACWDVLQALGDQHPFLLRGMGHGVVKVQCSVVVFMEMCTDQFFFVLPLYR